MSGTQTSLQASDGHQLSAYRNDVAGAVGGVVIVQEIFGVNPHIRSMVDRYSAKGYNAIAPALFDRVELGVELGYDTEGLGAGMAYARQLTSAQTMADIEAAVEALGDGPVAVVGYCLGGTLAWQAAVDLPITCAVGYYGGGIHGLNDLTPKAPTMLHFGALDDHISLASVEDIAASHPEVPVHVYEEAGHGFNCDARASYDRDAAVLAQERTDVFLAANGMIAAPS